MIFRRLSFFRLILLAAFLLFVGRLGYLQLFQGFELRDISERNRLRWVRVAAPRGLILDRNGRELATCVPGPVAWLVPGEIPHRVWPRVLMRLTALGFYPDLPTAQAALEGYRHYSSYLPVRLASNMSIQAVSRLVEELSLVDRLPSGETLPYLPGVYLRDEPVRRYPDGALASHLIGYLREIDADELLTLRERGYRMGDRLGKTGIERAYEPVLAGIEGGEQVEVDAAGHVLRKLRSVPPHPGEPVRLTLDLDIQRAAEEGLKGRMGAVVALDPRTGDVLALASAPGYDLNKMSARVTPPMLAWLQGRQRPELNRTTCGAYPPGSVFKIVTASAVLEKGLVTAQSTFFCSGSYHGIHCWKHNGHGTLNLIEAIAQSCNVAFMQMAERAGIQDLAATARRFGLGQPVTILPQVRPLTMEGNGDLTGILPEQAGLVPDPEWAKDVRHSPWQMGETLQSGIGQASLTITPMQAARIISAIANGGRLVTPRLVAAVGVKREAFAPAISIGLQPSTLRALQQGLRAVVGEGTAKSLDSTLHIAGKTGTAQNPGIDHAWFVGYAPTEAPKIAVAVIVEHGGHGGVTAAPIAQAVIRAALQRPGTHDERNADGH